MNNLNLKELENIEQIKKDGKFLFKGADFDNMYSEFYLCKNKYYDISNEQSMGECEIWCEEISLQEIEDIKKLTIEQLINDNETARIRILGNQYAISKSNDLIKWNEEEIIKDTQTIKDLNNLTLE